MPNKDELIIKMNEAIEAPSIILATVMSSRVSVFLIMLVTRSPATYPLQKYAPMNSKKLPRMTSHKIPRAFDPYEVASAFAASFAPIEKDMRKERIVIKIIYPNSCMVTSVIYTLF